MSIDWQRVKQVLAEEMASHGFVVVGMDHQTTPAAVFPDGTVVRGLTTPPSLATQVLDRTADAQLVLNQLEQWQMTDPLLAGHLDLDHIGASGFDLGGSTAASLANADARCKAAANLTGRFYSDDMVASGCAKPYLMIREDTPDPADSTDNRLAFFQHCHAAAYYLKLAGTLATSFFEDALLLDTVRFAQFYGPVTTDGYHAHAFARSALVSFFNRHLKGEEDGVLDQFFTNCPEVSLALQINCGP